MTDLMLYKSPWKAIKLILLSSIFVLGGLYMLNGPDAPSFVAWAGILFFGLAMLVGIYHLLDRRPQIIINEIGIFDRTVHKNVINWEIIQDAYLAEIYRQKFICLVVDEQFEPSGSKGKFAKNMSKLSKSIGCQELNIPLGSVKVDAEKLTDLVLLLRTAERSNRESLIRKALPDQYI
ncbi:STM3941 family protein [Flavitalea flava]